MEVAIIGGGAAGFFLAVNLKTFAPQVQVTVFERQADVLKKVLVSGGGRCNLTNTFEGVTDLKQVYPRGHKLLKGLFKQFGHRDATDGSKRTACRSSRKMTIVCFRPHRMPVP